MNKILKPKFLPLIVAIAGLLGMLLRIWTIGHGADSDGLYERHTLAWVLIWIVTALTLGLVVMITHRLKNPGRYADNFPPSPISAFGCLLAAVGVMLSALELVTTPGDTLALTAGIFGIAAGCGLVVVGICRFRGQKPHFLCHGAVCLFLALKVFYQCKLWSNEPQLGVFLFPFLALICAMLAAYQLAAYDVDLGKRRASLFWSLSGAYFSLLALPGSEDGLLFVGIALWLIANLCSLRPLNKRRSQPEEAPDTPEE